MKFKGTKGSLNITDNGNSQMAIYGEDLKCIAFIPKLHEESKEYSVLFKYAPKTIEMLNLIVKQIEIEHVSEHLIDLKDKAEELLKEATTI